MQFVKARPSEYLVVGESGEIKNLGIAASAYLWRKSSHVFIYEGVEAHGARIEQYKKDRRGGK